MNRHDQSGGKQTSFSPEQETARDITEQNRADGQAQRDKDAHNAPILEQMAILERQSQRMQREHALGHGQGPDGKTPKQRLQDVEDQIVALRERLQ